MPQNDGDRVEVTSIKLCDICLHVKGKEKPNVAMYDTRTITGQWANICLDHIMQYGEYPPHRLGTGRGQKLIYPEGLVAHYLRTGETSLPEVTPIRLFGWGTSDEDVEKNVKPRLFGEIVKLAFGVVREYHSDLYHDALRIKEVVTGPCEFDLLLRYHGTHISFDGDTYNNARSMGLLEMNTESTTLYRVNLYHDDRGEWFVTFTPINKSTAL